MDWITGMQRSIDYIEEHLSESIDYEAVAARAFSSSYHFQRAFSILCGFTVGEYIRRRRLSLAGTELAAGDIKVLDAAVKYGYESPDSFAKAFQKFHGITPSAARTGDCKLKFQPRLVLKISLEGGSIMDYRIEVKPERIYTGFKRRFIGTPAERLDQEHDFYISTRANQYILWGLSRDCVTTYNIMNAFDDDGYDFYIASLLDEWTTNNLEKTLGAEDAKRFETIKVPQGMYLICETERTKYPTNLVEDLRKKAVSEWLPSSGTSLSR